MGALPRLPWWRRPGRGDREAALDGARAGRAWRGGRDDTFGELSGGQRQRVLIARGLVQDAEPAAAGRAVLGPRRARRARASRR